MKELPNSLNKKSITINSLWFYIKSNYPQISNLGIKLEYNKMLNGGNKYYSEEGEYIDLFILDNHIQIGYVFVSEDDVNWDQPEVNKGVWLYDMKDNRTPFEPKELYHMLINYHSLLRDKKLTSIGL